MPKNPPFLKTDDYPDGLTRSKFRRLSKARKLELMLDWFHANYEDPAERTPYETAEGGYQWIWGGPYDAREELYDMFGTTVPEQLIEEAADQIESDGLTDWAPVRTADDYDEDDGPLEPYPQTYDDIPDDPGPAYGTEVDHRLRNQAIAALDEAYAALNTATGGIGHNRPPQSITETDDATDPAALGPVVSNLKAELEKQNPTISTVKQLARRLGDVAAITLKWMTKKLDVMTDEVAKTAGKGIVVGAVMLEPQVQRAVEKAFDLIVKWLHIVTLP